MVWCCIVKQKQPKPIAPTLAKVRQAQALIAELEGLLPAAAETNFRRRLLGHVKHLEQLKIQSDADTALRLKAGVLLIFFKQHFGVSKFFEHPGMMSSDPMDATNSLEDSHTQPTAEK